jgi:alanyl-tRNA synthetase
MRLLGLEDSCMAELITTSIDSMKDQYPDLEINRDRIISAAVGEETSFRQTLKSGTARFESAVQDLVSSNAKVLSADKVFEMHDTFGFPFDLTLEMADERGLSIDADGFKKLMNQQRDRAKADAKGRKANLADLSVYRSAAEVSGATSFIGYKTASTETSIGSLIVAGTGTRSAKQGDVVEVILPTTPFYAEGGGQLGDSGRLVTTSGSIIEIDDVQQPISGLYVHMGRVIDGEVLAGDEVLAEIDVARRTAISRAHTATHMIHKAFREQLGDSATQMGSENAPGRLRFDFPSPQAVPRSMLIDVEQRVNELLIENLPVTEALMTQAAAQQIGAMALFGEKYGDEVRVISVGDWAKELCGGTHTSTSGQLGVVTFLSESSIGAGIRRIEALVGSDAHAFLATEHLLVNQISEMLKVKSADIPERIDSLLNKLKDAERLLEQQRRNELLANADQIVGPSKRVSDYDLYAFQADLDMESLRELVARTKGTNSNSIVIAFGAGESPALIVGVGANLVSSEINAKSMLQVITNKYGGKGGGKPEMTQGSVPASSDIKAILAVIPSFITDLK